MMCVGRAALAGAALTLALVAAPAAEAFPQRGHTFAFAFGQPGSGEGQLQAPSGIAVNQSNGDVYVADYANNRVEVFEPQHDAGGALTGEKYLRSISVPLPTSVVVDSSTDSSDPSRGDVYVVGSSKHEVKEEEPNGRIFKFNPDGKQLAVIRKFKEPVEKGEEPEEAEALEEIQGLAADPRGDLYVYSSGSVDVFSDVTPKNKGLFSVPAPIRATRAFALDSEDAFYVGHESENSEAAGPEGAPAVIAKLEAITGTTLSSELDAQPSSAVAVNTEDVSTTGVDEENDAYVANPEVNSSTIAAFSPEGFLLQRFSAPNLRDASAIAIEDSTGTVFVADDAADDIDVFSLEAPGNPSIQGLHAQLLQTKEGQTNAIRLDAQVNPDGASTTGYFQYGAAGCSEDPAACTSTTPAGIGGSFTAQPQTVELSDLPPGAYHYRVVASNANGATESREQTFTILSQTPGLPDNRSWEMVSPPNKHGAAIEALGRAGGLILAAKDGGAITYAANGSISEEAQGNRSFEPQQVLSTRSPAGWSTQDIATPNAEAAGANFGAPEYQFFSPDLSVALVQPYGGEPPLAPEATGETVYLRDDPPLVPEAAQQESYSEAQANSGFLAPGFFPLLSKLTAPEAPLGASPTFLDATPDLRHAVVLSGAPLSGVGSAPGLYEWSPGTEVHFVSVLPGGQPQPVSQLALGYYQVRAHAISDDGTHVIWTASQETPAHLYERDTTTEKTIQLDAAQGVIEPQGAARFQTASGDGSRVFFTDDQELLEGARTEPEREVSDLYECEVSETGGQPTCVLRDLTIPLNSYERGNVQGAALGASEDGSTVYLVAHGMLAENENTVGETAKPGRDNLYELHYDGKQWARTFIAVLSPEDSLDWDQGGNVSDENTAFQTARVSPNGEYLAFVSNRSLTGYDNEDASSRHLGERLDEEVYLFNAQTHDLTCVSCAPSGARPTGVLDQEHSGEGIGLLVDRRESWRGHWISGSIPGWTSESLTNALIQSRYLSDEGRLLFDSADALVPGISAPLREEQLEGGAQQVGVENVYEYEPASVGGCTSSGGCVALISSGTSSRESALLEATPNGSEVFFLTAAQLSPQDTDDAFDVYDARVCSADSPCLAPSPGSQAPCGSVRDCHAAPSGGQAEIGASGSAIFSGPGDFLPTPPKQEVKDVKTTKPLTRAEKLTKALQACRRKYTHSKRQRLGCEAHAHKLYGPKRKPNKTARTRRDR